MALEEFPIRYRWRDDYLCAQCQGSGKGASLGNLSDCSFCGGLGVWEWKTVKTFTVWSLEFYNDAEAIYWHAGGIRQGGDLHIGCISTLSGEPGVLHDPGGWQPSIQVLDAAEGSEDRAWYGTTWPSIEEALAEVESLINRYILELHDDY